MATTNYLKVHRRYLPAVDFFFDSQNALSVLWAKRAAHELATALHETAQAHADGAAAAAKTSPTIVEPTSIAVWAHGVRGLGDLKCVGGCELCSPRPDLEIVPDDDAEVDDDGKTAVL